MRILVIKFCGLRGSLAASASFRAIKELHPSAVVTFVTLPGSEPAARGCPMISETIGYDLNSGMGAVLAFLGHVRRQRFDVAIALSPHHLARQMVAWSGARRRVCMGRAPFYLAPFFHQQVTGLWVDPHEAARDYAVLSEIFNLPAEVPTMWFAPSRMDEHGLLVDPRKYLVIHPGASHPEQVLEIDKWAAAARELIAGGVVERVVVSAGPSGSEKIMAEALCGLIGPVAQSTRGQLTFSQLAKLLQDSRVFLGADSAVLQLAAAVKVPVVAVFGPSDYGRARPWGTLSRTVRIDTTIFEGEDTTDYRARMDRALSRITPGQIVRATEEVLRIAG